MISEVDLVKVDSLIGFLDAAIGEMLKAITQIKLMALAHAHTETDMIAKLERAAKLAVGINESRRN